MVLLYAYDITFLEQCPCTLSACKVQSSITWPIWTFQRTGDKSAIPANAVDIRWDELSQLWFYRVPAESFPCNGDFSWVWDVKP